MKLSELSARFATPPGEFGMIPFWFWNDDLADDELLDQVGRFHAAGFGGFIPHARIGLSRRVGYLTPEHFRLLRLVCTEARRLGMRVFLYDEGSYPSGSAQGQVVAGAPDLAARCLIPVVTTVRGPARGFWRPDPGRALTDELVSVIACMPSDPEQSRLLSWEEPGVVRYDLEDGEWQLTSCWSVLSGGTIRGVLEEEEDGSALAPPAADILRPDAVERFIALTHDRFAEQLGDFFGDPIVGVFTDEPNPLGREPRRGPDPKPYTPGLLDDLGSLWGEDAARWLPALWFDCGERTTEFRRAYERVVRERLDRVFYRALSQWCADHGLLLTGHPQRSDELRPLRHFHIPGQDVVWRHVTPGWPDEGPDSVAPKVASSAALLARGCLSATELFGAYGWQLSFDEAKWLIDWHAVRGNTVFFPHACYYSVRGRRAFESPPDIGIHNAWWPHWRLLADYARRVSAVLASCTPVCRVGVLVDEDRVGWQASRELLQGQIGFLYLSSTDVRGALAESGRLLVAGQALEAVVVEPGAPLDNAARAVLRSFRGGGGLVVESWESGMLASRLDAVGPDVEWRGGGDLRVLHLRASDADVFLLTNEGEQPLVGEVALPCTGGAELWDPLSGSVQSQAVSAGQGRTSLSLRLERRQGVFLVVSPTLRCVSAEARLAIPGEVAQRVGGEWSAEIAGEGPVPLPCPGDWAQVPGWERYAGTVSFCTSFDAGVQPPPAFLDLGLVGDIAETILNGRSLGVRAWSPYVFALGETLRPGRNELTVRVTNSSVNAYEGAQRHSGILGPVTLRFVADG